MNAGWINVSFWLSLVTNLVVFSGVLSLFYWVRGNVTNNLVARHRLAVELSISFTFHAYLFMEALTNTYLGPHAFGLHWTFLNLIIVACLLFNIVLQSRIQLAFSIVTTILYVVMASAHYSVTGIALTALLIAIQIWFNRYGDWVRHARWSYHLVAIGYAVCSVATVYTMSPTTLDGWFWVRQTVAFLIVNTAMAEYALALRRRNDRIDNYYDEALTDSLTGIKNMGTFNTDVCRLYDRYQRTGAPYIMYEVDIDYFKRVNDTYGHPVGNVVLQRVAETLRELADELKNDASVYRMGGEEFGLVVQGEGAEGNLESAKQIGREIMARIDALRFAAANTEFSINVSIGLERVVPEDNNYLDIYNKADKYLYLSKQNGRDAITFDGDTFERVSFGANIGR